MTQRVAAAVPAAMNRAPARAGHLFGAALPRSSCPVGPARRGSSHCPTEPSDSAVAPARGADAQHALLHAFFVLLAETPDTNVLFRGGTEGLQFIQTQAADFLERGSVFETGWQARAESLHRRCSIQNLSPGGCADLLAAAWFVHQVQTDPL